MLDFWDRLFIVYSAAVHDYYKKREEQRRKWADFCLNCTSEILTECANISAMIEEATRKQSGSHVHKDLYDGIIQLPLYGFHLVLSLQDGLTKEQSKVLQMFFSNFRIPYTMNLFLESTRMDNYVRRNLYGIVGISEDYAGAFWVQFFKVLYRTESDTTYIQKIIDSFCNIMMRFAALSGSAENYLLSIMERFLKNVHRQSVLCRQVPEDSVDYFGDAPFMEHFRRYKEETFKVCNLTMSKDEDGLNPDSFFRGFTLGGICQVVKRCNRRQSDKAKMIDDILSKIEMDDEEDGADLIGYMENYEGESGPVLGSLMHVFTDIEGGNPVGWILLARLCGTYGLKTGKNLNPVQEAINFLLGMENYLSDNYPMSGFGKIALKYTGAVMEFVNKDIDENVTIV